MLHRSGFLFPAGLGTGSERSSVPLTQMQSAYTSVASSPVHKGLTHDTVRFAGRGAIHSIQDYFSAQAKITNPAILSNQGTAALQQVTAGIYTALAVTEPDLSTRLQVEIMTTPLGDQDLFHLKFSPSSSSQTSPKRWVTIQREVGEPISRWVKRTVEVAKMFYPLQDEMRELPVGVSFVVSEDGGDWLHDQVKWVWHPVSGVPAVEGRFDIPQLTGVGSLLNPVRRAIPEQLREGMAMIAQAPDILSTQKQMDGFYFSSSWQMSPVEPHNSVNHLLRRGPVSELAAHVSLEPSVVEENPGYPSGFSLTLHPDLDEPLDDFFYRFLRQGKTIKNQVEAYLKAYGSEGRDYLNQAGFAVTDRATNETGQTETGSLFFKLNNVLSSPIGRKVPSESWSSLIHRVVQATYDQKGEPTPDGEGVRYMIVASVNRPII